MSAPPPLHPATRWVLARAFLHPDLPVEVPPDINVIWSEATRLRMAPRIATRFGKERLIQDLGEPFAQRFLDASRQAALQALKVEAQVRHLAAIAEKRSLQFALLKGAALHILRIVALGARPLCDLDILMSPKAAKELQRLLKAQGWRESESLRTDFHLPPLHASPWLTIEVHDVIPRVSLNGLRWSGFDELRTAGLLNSCSSVPGCVFVPELRLLAAHAFVARQVLTISGLADYVALRLANDGKDDGSWVEEDWVATQLCTQRFAEAVSAADELARSMKVSAAQDTCAVGALERAGSVFDEKQRVTWSTALHPKKGSPTPIRGVLRRALVLAFPPTTRLDSRYGRPTWRVAYVWLYLRRILDALARTLVGGVADGSGRGGSEQPSNDTSASSPGPTSDSIGLSASEGASSCLDHHESPLHAGQDSHRPTR